MQEICPECGSIHVEGHRDCTPDDSSASGWFCRGWTFKCLECNYTWDERQSIVKPTV